MPETWAALILYLARVDADKARAELALVQQRLPKDRLPQVLAPAYEALGNLKRAGEYYRLLAVPGNAPTALREVAAFYVRSGQQSRAEPALRRLLEPATGAPEETVRWARRMLALGLAFQDGSRHFRAALALLDENGKAGSEAVEDRRFRALVLASKPAHRREAIRLLEGLFSRRVALEPNFHLLLARLHETEGDWPGGRARNSLACSVAMTGTRSSSLTM